MRLTSPLLPVMRCPSAKQSFNFAYAFRDSSWLHFAHAVRLSLDFPGGMTPERLVRKVAQSRGLCFAQYKGFVLK
jgi:hypothetical protein